MTSTARYVGMWNGGVNYAASQITDAETFGSIREAADAIRDRRDLGHHYPQTFRYVFRPASSDLTPCAHDDSSGGIDLYRVDGLHPDYSVRDVLSEGMPDVRLTIGPRGGIVREP